ncbi:MAG: hypothetical protein J2P50_00440 [Hyphomicrobiaceae bacterium]|nr:hypothetical protein [Hyphomicrobiaceae bacterium]
MQETFAGVSLGRVAVCDAYKTGEPVDRRIGRRGRHLGSAARGGPALGPQTSQARQRQLIAAKGQPRSPAPEQPAGLARSAEERAHEASEHDARDRERAALDRRLGETAAVLAEHAVGLTYGAVALIVLTAGLWLTSLLGARDLRAAVRAIEASSAAAQRSTRFMQRALVLNQRATVIVGEPKAAWLRDAGDRLVGCRLLVTWHNVGATPTRDMIAAIAGLATEKPPSQTNALPRTDARRQPAIVGPNAAINSASVNLPIGLVAGILRHRPITCSPARPSTTMYSSIRRATAWSSATGSSSRAT